eukprot:2575875-Rhodomonas_salina.1
MAGLPRTVPGQSLQLLHPGSGTPVPWQTAAAIAAAPLSPGLADVNSKLDMLIQHIQTQSVSMDTMERKMEGFIPLLDSVAQSASGPTPLLGVADTPQGDQLSPPTTASGQAAAAAQDPCQSSPLVSPFPEDDQYDPTVIDLGHP